LSKRVSSNAAAITLPARAVPIGLERAMLVTLVLPSLSLEES
jgi:hypothetical protein